MLRTGILLLIWILACGKILAGINVELDVVFRDSILQCRYIYVLSPNVGGTNDTVAVFDTLSFDGKNRVSLFYTVASGSNQMLSIIDSNGRHFKSKMFEVSPQRTVFVVAMGQKIKIICKDYMYPRKNENEHSYFVFLLIFFVVKIVIVAVFILSSRLPKRNITISSGAFLLSAFLDWLLPIHYLYRFLLIILVEYLLIALVGRRSISWFRAMLLVLTVNMVGFGLIIGLYLWFVFW